MNLPENVKANIISRSDRNTILSLCSTDKSWSNYCQNSKFEGLWLSLIKRDLHISDSLIDPYLKYYRLDKLERSKALYLLYTLWKNLSKTLASYDNRTGWIDDKGDVKILDENYILLDTFRSPITNVKAVKIVIQYGLTMILFSNGDTYLSRNLSNERLQFFKLNRVGQKVIDIGATHTSQSLLLDTRDVVYFEDTYTSVTFPGPFLSVAFNLMLKNDGTIYNTYINDSYMISLREFILANYNIQTYNILYLLNYIESIDSNSNLILHDQLRPRIYYNSDIKDKRIISSDTFSHRLLIITDDGHIHGEIPVTTETSKIGTSTSMNSTFRTRTIEKIHILPPTGKKFVEGIINKKSNDFVVKDDENNLYAIDTKTLSMRNISDGMLQMKQKGWGVKSNEII